MNRTTIDESRLIGSLKELGLTDAIKQVETIDEELVSQYVLEQKIPATILDAVTTTKTSTTLRVYGAKR